MTIRQTNRKSRAGLHVESLEKAKKEAKANAFVNPQGQQRHVAGLILSNFCKPAHKGPMRVARIILTVV